VSFTPAINLNFNGKQDGHQKNGELHGESVAVLLRLNPNGFQFYTRRKAILCPVGGSFLKLYLWLLTNIYGLIV